MNDPNNLNLQDLGGASAGAAGSEAGLEAVYDVPVTVKAVLGTTNMPISQLLKLGRGAIVPLDKKVGDAVDIYVNDRLVARGEVVIFDEKLGVTMTEIVKAQT
jgi:flagellar motor switch protein FliN/FliY